MHLVSKTANLDRYDRPEKMGKTKYLVDYLLD